MERKIGEIFEYNGEWYQCKKSDPAVNADGIMDCCEGCSMTASECADFNCSDYERLDKTQVIFKKLEKVGEPYSDYCPTGRTIHFQRYKCYQKPIIEGNIVWHWPDDNFIDIEIKQNKEDINKEELITIHGKTVKRIKGNCFDCCFYSKGMCELTMKEAEAQNCGMGMIYMEVKQNKEDMEEKTIKIKKEDIKVGSKVIYLPSNRPYVITEANCRMKYDGDWHDCVIYTPLYDNPYKCFVRPIKDFAQNFVLDSAEEKEEKYSNLESTGKNLKPFDLEAAKAGKPVYTRDGRKARIICFDRDWDMHIVALVADPLGESVHYYLSNGKVDFDRQLDDDLMMLPEKKEGWVNVYKDSVYDTKDKALIGRSGNGYIDTIKVEWEE